MHLFWSKTGDFCKEKMEKTNYIVTMDSNSRQFDTMFVIYMPIRYMGSKLWHILTKMLPIMLKYELF